MKRGGGNSSSKKADHETVEGEDLYDHDGPNESKSYEDNKRDHALFWSEKPFVEKTYYPNVFEERNLPTPNYFSYNATDDHKKVERGRRYQETKGVYEDRPSSEEEVRDEVQDTMSGRSMSGFRRELLRKELGLDPEELEPEVDLKRTYPK